MKQLLFLKILAGCIVVLYNFARCNNVNNDVNNNSDYVQQTFNLIENIINWHNFNTKFWFIVFIESSRDSSLSSSSFWKYFLEASIKVDKPKIIYHGTNINSTQSRDFAVIYFISGKESIENQLKLCTKYPPDIPKIYIDLMACQLNESQLDESMKNLWEFDEIAFIYYISFCSSSNNNYETIDSRKLSRAVSHNHLLDPSQHHLKGENNCTINLFYYHPFEMSVGNSSKWGVFRRVNLINDMDIVDNGGRRINMSNSIFRKFPFQQQHRLNLNRMNMTVILFPSTNSYFRKELNILRSKTPKNALDNPFNHSEAYFGEDAEFFNEIKILMNFTAHISPTTDHKFYGYRVS